MAAGDALLDLRAPFGIMPAASMAGVYVTYASSSPQENLFFYAFDAAATEYMDWRVTIPGHYGGGGMAFEVEFAMASATTNSVRLEAAVRYLDPTESFAASHTYSYQGVTVTVPASLARKATGTIIFTGAQADLVPAKGEAIIRFRRKHDHAGDTASGDMLLARIYVREKSAGE